MHSNPTPCQPGLAKTERDDLFPKDGTELIEDFLPLESCGLMYQMERNRSHPLDQMMRLQAQLEHDFYDRLIFWSQKQWVSVWLAKCWDAVDSMPGELELYHGPEHCYQGKEGSMTEQLNSLL